MSKIVKYEHHGTEVSVLEKNKGKHRENCLCWLNCKHFKPEDRKNNCSIANELFSICVDCSVVTPVWECAKYEKDV